MRVSSLREKDIDVAAESLKVAEAFRIQPLLPLRQCTSPPSCAARWTSDRTRYLYGETRP